MDTPVRTRRRALTASTAIVVAAVLGTTGLAWGSGDIRRAGVVPQQETPAGRGDGFVAVEPVRILDTRPPENGPIGVPSAGPLLGGQQIDLPLTTSAPNARSIPLPEDTTAVLVNVTIDGDSTQRSFLTVWPEGTPRPFASADNAEPGLVMPNLTLVKLGPSGGISIYAQAGAINLAIDLVGYTVPLPDVPPNPPEPPVEGLLFGTGPPSDSVGTTGSFYLDVVEQQLYGPKADDGWHGPAPLPTWASPESVSQGVDDSNLTMASGPDGATFDYGPEVTVWHVTGLVSQADYLLDAAVEVRPSALLTVDATIQCHWSTRPGRVFTLTLPLSLEPADLNEVAGTVSVPGSIKAGVTADLVCRVGSLEVLGGTIDLQSIQVDAHRVHLVNNS